MWGKTLPAGYPPLALCAQTAAAVDRNIIGSYRQMGCHIDRDYSKGTVRIDGQLMYVVGVSDRRAEDRIMGSTISGALVDELTLIEKSFFDKLSTRCSVLGAKMVTTCNPDIPGHWVFKDLISKPTEDQRVFFFDLDDNPTLAGGGQSSGTNECTAGVFYQAVY